MDGTNDPQLSLSEEIDSTDDSSSEDISESHSDPPRAFGSNITGIFLNKL